MAARVPTPNFSKMSNIKNAKHLPKPFKIRRFYTQEELAAHCTSDNCWVSFFDGVYDLTKILADNQTRNAELCKPIAAVAGEDITHWFDLVT